MIRLLADPFFHPDHAVPFIEFIAAVKKTSHKSISQMFMEKNTFIGQMFVLFPLRCRDAGIHDINILPQKDLLQFRVKDPANALPGLFSVHVDRGFHTVLIGCPGTERAGIGITDDSALLQRDKIRISFQCVFYAALKLLHIRNIIFKCDRRIGNIRGLDAPYRFGIAWFCNPDLHAVSVS